MVLMKYAPLKTLFLINKNKTLEKGSVSRRVGQNKDERGKYTPLSIMC